MAQQTKLEQMSSIIVYNLKKIRKFVAKVNILNECEGRSKLERQLIPIAKQLQSDKWDLRNPLQWDIDTYGLLLQFIKDYQNHMNDVIEVMVISSQVKLHKDKNLLQSKDNIKCIQSCPSLFATVLLNNLAKEAPHLKAIPAVCNVFVCYMYKFFIFIY